MDKTSIVTHISAGILSTLPLFPYHVDTYFHHIGQIRFQEKNIAERLHLPGYQQYIPNPRAHLGLYLSAALFFSLAAYRIRNSTINGIF